MNPSPRGPFRPALAAAAVLLASVVPGGTTIMKFMTIEELARASTEVVRGTVLGQSAHWTEDHAGIYTIVDVAVNERLKGSRPLSSVAQVVYPGGELDGTRMIALGLPSYAEGEEVFLFLVPASDDPSDGRVQVLGGKMGKLPVVPGPAGGEPLVIRQLNDVDFAEFVADGGRPEMRLVPAREPRRLSLGEFRRRVLEAGAAPPSGRGPGARP